MNSFLPHVKSAILLLGFTLSRRLVITFYRWPNRLAPEQMASTVGLEPARKITMGFDYSLNNTPHEDLSALPQILH